MNIPSQLSEFDFFLNDPFVIFEKNKFLDANLYNQLDRTFPNVSFFESKHKLGNKLFLNNKSNTFFDFMNANHEWNLLYKYFKKEETAIRLFELFSREISKIEERKKIQKISIIKNYSNNLISKFKKIYLGLSGYTSIRIGFEFSLIANNCFIPPHCDTDNKLLSLMMYFPPSDHSKDVYENLGTNFYQTKSNAKKNFDSWHSTMLNNDETISFNDNYEIFYKSLFSENKLVGFIKNNKSWHDASAFQNKKFWRRSININLYLV